MPARQVTPLDALQKLLTTALNIGLHRNDGWSDDAANKRMVEKVKEQHDGPGQPPDSKTVAMAVAYFRRTGEVENWLGLKRVCFGVGLVNEKDWCILSDGKLLNKLIDIVQGQTEARKRVKCYQSLLSSYWSFHLATADAKAKAGWLVLREWLDKKLDFTLKDLNSLRRMPGWFQTLTEHRNLLHDNPCGRYGQNLLLGDGTPLQMAISGLGIPSASWVPEEALLAHMRAGCDVNNQKFQEFLPYLLSVAMGQGNIQLTQSLQMRCVAMLVIRYAKLPTKPENPALRDAAVVVIGNPWLRRPSWDANVVNEYGKPDNTARDMVDGWLKRRLIKDFFQLLSADGAGDSRRLDYWMRFEPYIDDMWFALGLSARNHRGEAFKDFRSRARGRLLHLEGTKYDNNTFIMRIGNFVSVEFGEMGNALYFYKWERLPPLVSEKFMSGEHLVSVTISQLKSAQHALLIKKHIDSPVALESWEQKFDAEICPILGVRPKEKPAFVPDLEALLKTYQVQAEDNRPRGGALWILADDSNRKLSTAVKALGFQYRSGRGWFKE